MASPARPRRADRAPQRGKPAARCPRAAGQKPPRSASNAEAASCTRRPVLCAAALPTLGSQMPESWQSSNLNRRLALLTAPRPVCAAERKDKDLGAFWPIVFAKLYVSASAAKLSAFRFSHQTNRISKLDLIGQHSAGVYPCTL